VGRVWRRTALLVLILALSGKPIPAFVSQNAGLTQPVEKGGIAGRVVNERREPVSGVTVQAFPASVATQQPAGQPPVLPPGGSASTDGQGRFRISGLEPGTYLLAAGPLPARALNPAATYAATFHPSTLDLQQAAPVIVSAGVDTDTSIELVPTRGVRLSGTVVNPSGRATAGMAVRLFSRFGGYGSGSQVGVVTDTGTFAVSNVLPGWYRLSIEPAGTGPNTARTEFAASLIEVRDHDLDNVSLVFSSGATIAGQVIAESGSQLTVPDGLLRVSASLTPEQVSDTTYQAATVGANGAFRLSIEPGRYVFAVRADRPPWVAATRITVDGLEHPLGSGVVLAEGEHRIVLSIDLHPLAETNRTSAPPVSSPSALEQFTLTPTLDVARQIVARGDSSVLTELVPFLSHDDRHIRGNAAFVFAGLGDNRGFDTIVAILNDDTYRPPGQGVAADRYYAAHLLGDIRDPRGVPFLIPLLRDPDVDDIVPWALGEIGGAAAVQALIGTLDDENPSMRVLAIYALETLGAKEALPRLATLANDQARSNFGNQVSVAAAARAAITALKGSMR
jgi:hypothetical protein